MNCIFCKIIANEIPCIKLIETAHTLAFLDIQPLSRGHLLLIPKHHGAHLTDIPDQALAEIGPQLKKLAKASQLEQYNVLQNNGALAHQEVDHVHFHLIPKHSATDGLVISEWKTIKMDKQELQSYADELKSRL